MASTRTSGLLGSAPLREWPDLQHPKLLDEQQLLDALAVSPLAPAAAIQVVKRIRATPYPPNWSEECDVASGALYFYNRLRDEAVWEHPMSETFREVIDLISQLTARSVEQEEMAASIEAAILEAQNRAVEDLKDWVGPIEGGAEGTTYYYNNRTGASEWEDPRERWQYDLQVRYDLLVGYLVSDERSKSSGSNHMQAPHSADFTQSLTSLASSISSMASTVNTALQAPSPRQEYARGDVEEARWAKPRSVVRPVGSLTLPPRQTRTTAVKPLYTSLPAHQQRYVAEMLTSSKPKEDSEDEQFSFRGTGGTAQVVASISRSPPPPPPGEPPRR